MIKHVGLYFYTITFFCLHLLSNTIPIINKINPKKVYLTAQI